MTRDLNGLRAALKQALPDADIHVEGLGDGIVLTGNVASPIEAQQAFDIAARLVDDGNKVVNGITVHGRDQVMLKVTVAEVQRDVIKQLGIDLQRQPSAIGSAVLNFNNTNPFPAIGQPLVATNAITGTWKSITATLRAMERAGVIRTLAEPNLTAISGESANFLAGGEFPIPAGYTCDRTTTRALNCQYQISVEEIRRRPQLHAGGAGRRPHQPQGHDRGLRALDREPAHAGAVGRRTRRSPFPSIKTRRAETTVEIPSGGSLAMAGMIAGADQAADQRHSRADAAAGSRHAVQEPRLRQQADRADGHGDALHRARGGTEGAVAAR